VRLLDDDLRVTLLQEGDSLDAIAEVRSKCLTNSDFLLCSPLLDHLDIVLTIDPLVLILRGWLIPCYSKHEFVLWISDDRG